MYSRNIIATVNQKLVRAIGSKALFYLILCMILIFMFSNKPIGHVDYLLVAQHLIIGSIAVTLILSGGSGLLAQTLGVFFLIAFCCFPIIEIFTGTIYWGAQDLDFLSRFKANLSIIACLALFMVSYRSGYRLKIASANFGPCVQSGLNLWQQIVMLGFGLGLACLVLHLYGWDYQGLLKRTISRSELNVEWKSTFLFVEFFLRPLIFNIGLTLLCLPKSNKAVVFASLCVGICVVFPFGVPRFLVAAMYLPFLLHLVFVQANLDTPKYRFPRLFLPNFLILGLFLIFPVIDLARTYPIELSSILRQDNMLSGHFDAYQMLVHAIDVGELTFGLGLLGTLLFFVPRAIWPTKPIVSGQEVAHQSGLSFDNVSMTLVGEMYLNFWYVGIVFGALLLGFLIRSVDHKFLSRKKYELSIQWVIYFQSIALFIFILRGSLLAAFAYASGVAGTWLIIWLGLRLFSIRIA